MDMTCSMFRHFSTWTWHVQC